MSGVRYDLEDCLILFGVGVCRLTERLPATPLGSHVGSQIIRSSTSLLANYGEVQGAESRRDFIHKLSICVKELRETRAWLKLIAAMDLCAAERLRPVMSECDQLLAILTSSIRTARRRMENVQ